WTPLPPVPLPLVPVPKVAPPLLDVEVVPGGGEFVADDVRVPVAELLEELVELDGELVVVVGGAVVVVVGVDLVVLGVLELLQSTANAAANPRPPARNAREPKPIRRLTLACICRDPGLPGVRGCVVAATARRAVARPASPAGERPGWRRRRPRCRTPCAGRS